MKSTAGHESAAPRNIVASAASLLLNGPASGPWGRTTQVSDARTPGSTVVERPYQPVGRPSPGPAVRETAQGTWFLPVDAPGSLLRLPAGADAGAVRRLRRLGLPGLMPIATVLEDDGRVWVATPVPTGPTVDDLLVNGRDLGLGPGDAAAVLSSVGRTLRALHTRGLGHGALDPSEVVIAPDGAPLLVAVMGGILGASA